MRIAWPAISTCAFLLYAVPGPAADPPSPRAAGAAEKTGDAKTTEKNVAQQASPDDFTWQDLAKKYAVISIENRTATPVTLSASLGDFGFFDSDHSQLLTNSEAGIQPLDKNLKAAKLAAGATRRYQLASTAPDSLHIRPGKYTAILLLRLTGKPESARTISVTVPGIEPATAAELQSRATRPFPFTSEWETQVSIPLSTPIVPRLAIQNDVPLGVLTRDSGPGFAVVKSVAGSDSAAVTQLDVKVSGIESAGLYKGSISFPGGKSSAISILAADYIGYPILVIVLGIVVGSSLKRWLNVGREVRLYKRNVALLRAGFLESSRSFLQQTAGQPYRGDSIEVSFEAARLRLLDSVKTLKLSTKALDNTNTDYQKAQSDLKSLQTAAQGWKAFAGNLNGLQRALDQIQHSGVPQPHGASAEPSIAARKDLLLGKPAMSLEDFSQARADVTSAQAAAAKWMDLANRYLAAVDLSTALNTLLTDAADQNALAAIRLDAVRILLWAAANSGQLTRVEQNLGNCEALLDALRQKTSLPAVPAPQPLAADLQAPDEAQAGTAIKLADRAIQFGDWMAFFIAVVAGTLTALQTYYFNKPFGTFADYATVFLWGIGSKAIVDLAAMGVDKALLAVTKASPAAAG